ncbi:uncharacterized protein LOC134830263 [Culicoides brevitarsis]|uniref:uncharacterized protein LOC134830263 n=1 Tax=Culicoides brevitarsis TaxID=469753 RepID=UPI00307C1FEE
MISLFLVFLGLVQISLQESCHYDTTAGTLELKSLESFPSFQSYQQFDEPLNKTWTTYFFHPCTDTKTPVGNEGCKEGFSLCKKETNVTDTKIESTYTIVGKSSDGVFKVEANNSIFLKFNENLIQLVCTALLPLEQSKLVLTPDKNLIFYSSAACLMEHAEISHSVGSILLLILGILMIVYFIGGYLFKYIMQGSRGFEAFPHYEFWTDLPSLVRDGIRFLQNGCRPAAETQDSYESI